MKSKLQLAALLLPLLLAPQTAWASDLHARFDLLLQRYVVDEWVDYGAWHDSGTDLAELDTYLDELQEIDPADLDGDDARLAFWINLYNAATLDLVLDAYPIESIKDLGGVFSSPWDREVVEVAGLALTLNAIENEIIRVRFDEPRIHFALNCASVGCPPLAGRAYTAARIEAQLQAATVRTLTDPDWVDATGCGAYGSGVIRLTKIFDWYGEDFGGEAGVRAFLGQYLPEARFALRNRGCALDYRDYDWSLNDLARRASR